MHFAFIKDLSEKDERLVVGLDIGTSKICAVVAEVPVRERTDMRGGPVSLNVLGIGTASSRGIRKGAITNIENMSESIREAVREAEHSAGVEIRAVHIGIGDGNIGCLPSHGVIAVKEKEIGQDEVDNVIDAARAVALPFDREMLHVIPSGFTVNGQNGITDPRGMGGVRLETSVHIVTCATTSLQNLIRSCQRADLEVIDVMFQPLASSQAMLTPDEKELGIAVVDIGGGTTDIALFHEGSVCHASVITVGGNNFTNDIAVGLRIPSHEAEKLKKRHGCVMLSMMRDNEEMDVSHAAGAGRRTIPRSYLIEILQPRAEELFTLIKKEITETGLHHTLNAGVVLTGGAVLMEGMDIMAENVLDLPVRTGRAEGIEGPAGITDNPSYTTAIGLALHGGEDEIADTGPGSGRLLTGIRSRMTGLLKLFGH